MSDDIEVKVEHVGRINQRRHPHRHDTKQRIPGKTPANHRDACSSSGDGGGSDSGGSGNCGQRPPAAGTAGTTECYVAMFAARDSVGGSGGGPGVGVGAGAGAGSGFVSDTPDGGGGNDSSSS